MLPTNLYANSPDITLSKIEPSANSDNSSFGVYTVSVENSSSTNKVFQNSEDRPTPRPRPAPRPTPRPTPTPAPRNKTVQSFPSGKLTSNYVSAREPSCLLSDNDCNTDISEENASGLTIEKQHTLARKVLNMDISGAVLNKALSYIRQLVQDNNILLQGMTDDNYEQFVLVRRDQIMNHIFGSQSILTANYSSRSQLVTQQGGNTSKPIPKNYYTISKNIGLPLTRESAEYWNRVAIHLGLWSVANLQGKELEKLTSFIGDLLDHNKYVESQQLVDGKLLGVPDRVY